MRYEMNDDFEYKIIIWRPTDFIEGDLKYAIIHCFYAFFIIIISITIARILRHWNCTLVFF